jgi:hypothetical protein
MFTESCTECAKLFSSGDRRKPRPIVWRSPAGQVKLCNSHNRERIRLIKYRNHTAYVARVYGISRDDQARLWAYQGECCGGCGRKPSHKPDTDHDHELAKEHEHPDDQACAICMRGFLCRYCNKYILGMGYTADQLESVAAYLRDPPYQRMRREQNGSSA